MSIPRFKDGKCEYEVVLNCTICGYAVVKDRVTDKWKRCRLCGGSLKTLRSDYDHSIYKVNRGAGEVSR